MKEKRDDRLAYKGKTIRNGYVQRSDPAENAVLHWQNGAFRRKMPQKRWRRSMGTSGSA